MIPMLAQENLALNISFFWSLPFVALLACIALMPFVAKHWWEKKYPFVAGGLALIPFLYYLLIARQTHRWIAGMEDYVSFIILLGSLFVISGGVIIHMSKKATPTANCVLLLMGAVLANFFGTTGASMLLIRPYLRINKGHIKPYHVVFFIFLVSNVGGALTPVGDPPLFLGYLHGVPFWWVLEHCWKPWTLAVALLISIFFVIDTLDHKNQSRPDDHDAGPGVELIGAHNFLFIARVMFVVFREGFFEVLTKLHEVHFSMAWLGSLLSSREIVMIVAAILSKKLTAKVIYERNEFSMGPIKEVAILFIGIFSTMVPALQWLEVNAEKLPIKTPGHFYYASGTLSSVLDNAPTYMSFLQTRLGELDQDQVDVAMADLHGMSVKEKLEVAPAIHETPIGRAETQMIKDHPQIVLEDRVTREQVSLAFLLGNADLNLYLVAISLGSVFFGACTYIGNGPNFMVKSIADAAGVPTPHFLEYVYRYTLPILLPVYIVVWLVFLRG